MAMTSTGRGWRTSFALRWNARWSGKKPKTTFDVAALGEILGKVKIAERGGGASDGEKEGVAADAALFLGL